MNDINEQVKRLRRYALEYKKHQFGGEISGTDQILLQAANTIESLSAKLDMEHDGNDNRWIPCSEKLPETGKKVLVCYGVLGERSIAITQMYEYKNEKYWNIKSKVHAWQQLPEPYPKKRKIHREGEKNKSNHEISRK